MDKKKKVIALFCSHGGGEFGQNNIEEKRGN